MITGLYVGASSLVSQGNCQEIIARNLANVNTVGYKKAVPVFQAYLSKIQEGNVTNKKGIANTLDESIDFSSGSLEYTGNDLDMAIKGDGFFAVQTEDGIRYTRRGQFALSRDMKIVTHEGWPLMGNGGEIQVPKGAQSITVKANGGISVDGKEIDKVKVVEIPNVTDLESVGGCLYKLSDSASEPEISTRAEIAHHHIEKANVNAVDEMVTMIANLRSYQAGGKITESINQTLEKIINLAR
ncbi:MAG: flagellar basal-body rod protein FlgF [Planctomycetes bacterium]|nr:flagellar basal-body rod protein FlgF [Planctomycetota bacterium]